MAPPPDSATVHLNRELSWLDFNDRVLEEALDPTVPVLERLKFLSIYASNLDEFFMVRVAFIRRQIEAGLTRRGHDGMRPAEVMEKIIARVQQSHERIGDCFRNTILPALASEKILLVTDLTATIEQRAYAIGYFTTTLESLVTPLVLDSTHPFPQLENGALYFCVELSVKGASKSKAKLVLLRIPTNAVGRYFRLPSGAGTVHVMMIDDSIRLSLSKMFPGDRVLGCYQVKIVRDSELELDEVGSEDLMASIVKGLLQRKKGVTTRFLYDPVMPPHLIDAFAKFLKLSWKQMFEGARYHSFADMIQLPALIDVQSLMYSPMPPLTVHTLESAKVLLDVVREKDILIHHPYQSFSYVPRFVEEAANDPSVVAMKATLYRVSSDSRVASALVRAAHNGKQVTVLVELRARFDEERNIGWARTLKEAGAEVLYGVKGLKTHCKMLLVTRKEGDSVRRYCHLSTGNYNERTARLYCDLGLFTSHPGITGEVAKVFNRLTGDAPLKELQHLLVAPEFLRTEFVERIRRESGHARAGKRSGIMAKMNSLVDPDIIEELYAAARAGVPISLIIRGICCLKPGVTGLSENIEVTSIVDRYLEHARIYRFENDGTPELFLSSADWMPRNLNNRVEVAFPILDPEIQREVMELLTLQLSDTAKARLLQADGGNVRRTGLQSVRSQLALYERAKQQQAK